MPLLKKKGWQLTVNQPLFPTTVTSGSELTFAKVSVTVKKKGRRLEDTMAALWWCEFTVEHTLY